MATADALARVFEVGAADLLELFVVLVCGLFSLAGEAVGATAALILLVSTLSAGARRLLDNGPCDWRQLFALAPFGVVVPLILLTDGAARVAAGFKSAGGPVPAADAIEGRLLRPSSPPSHPTAEQHRAS